MTPSELGKSVFKNDDVPFYPVTHVLLGDSHLIKGSLRGRLKSDFLAMAKEGRWSLRTNTYIELKVKENNLPLPYAL